MKILIIDDSVVFRSAIKTALKRSPEVEESNLKTASNGKIALEFVKQSDFDALIVDLEMPVMDGVETIKEVRKFNKDVVIIIFSSQTLSSASKTLGALEMGADDFISKVEGDSVEENIERIADELIPRLNALVAKRKTKGVANKKEKLAPQERSLDNPITRIKNYSDNMTYEVLCIGASTGGAESLKDIFKDFNNYSTPILLVQHMPPIFTKQLAKMLNDVCQITVKEAEEGDIVEKGHCYVAPGDFHMTVVEEDEKKVIRLNQNEKVSFVRPAVDVLLESVTNSYKGKILCLILTGMGNDGLRGVRFIKECRGTVLIQDEETSVVWGMPGSVFKKNLHDDVIALPEIAGVLNKLVV